MKKDKKKKNVTVGLIFSWIFGVMFMLSGLGLLMISSYISGILVMIGSAVIIPYSRKMISNKLNMEFSKGIIILIAIVVFVIFTIAVPNENSDVEQEVVEEQTTDENDLDVEEVVVEETEEEEQIYSLGEVVETNYFEWKFLGYYTTDAIGEEIFGTFYGEEAGGEFIVISVEVENIDDSAHYISSSDLKIIDEEGREFSSNTMAAIYLENEDNLNFEQINPGIIKDGKVVFDVPIGLENLQLRISNGLFDGYSYVALE